MKTYTELCQYATFEDRFHYLQLHGTVGYDTFGFDRWLNQSFYQSREWRQFRDPLTKEDVLQHSDALLDPENVICVSDRTHKAIHYGDDTILKPAFAERRPGDTCPWRK